MKVVVINGSPRRDGLVSQMLGHVAAGSARRVRSRDAVRSRHGGPALHRVYEMPFAGSLHTARGRRPPRGGGHSRGGLIVGSPCYWGNMSGALKVLLDRMVYAMMGERENGMPIPLHKGKRARAGRHVQYGLSVQRVVPPDDRRVPCLARDIEMERFPGCRDFGPGRMPQTRVLTPREIVKCKKLAKKIC